MTSKFETALSHAKLFSFQRYLTDNLPKPSVIQAKIKVRILKKNYRFDGLVMKPNDELVVLFIKPKTKLNKL